MLDFELEADALAVFVAHKFEGDIPRGAREVGTGPVEINGSKEVFTPPHAKADMFFLEDIRAVNRGDILRVENRRGIADTAGLKERELLEMALVKVGHVNAGVELEARNKILQLQATGGGSGKSLAKALEIIPRDPKAGSHVVSAKRPEQVSAVTQGLDERKRLNAAPASMSIAGAIKADNNGGAVVLAAEAGGDDADNACVPPIAPDNHGAVTHGVKVFFDFLDGGLENLLLEVLTLAIALIEFQCEAPGFDGIGGKKELQGGLGSVEAPGGVEPRAEPEANLGGGERRNGAGDIHEGAQPHPFGVAEAGEAVADDDPVFAAQRGEVADGAHGGEVKKVAQIGIAAPGQLLDAVAELEDEGGSAEVGVSAGSLGINDGGAGGGAIFGLVVINDDKIHAARGEPCGLLVRGGSAVEGDEERRAVRCEDAVESVAAEPVAFRIAQREEAMGVEAAGRQKPVKDGEGCDAVHVIVAVKDNTFAPVQGLDNPAGGILDARRGAWIGEGCEARMEEVVGLARIGDFP